jgi:hypothetical protein
MPTVQSAEARELISKLDVLLGEEAYPRRQGFRRQAGLAKVDE